MILSTHASNGGPQIARSEPLSTERMLKVLRKRLGAVSLADLPKKKRSVKKVHRLRVATRKAISALAVCRPLLSKADVRKVEKALRAQRKALGEVRDWDVLISRVLCAPADQKADLRCDLLFYFSDERDRAWRRARKAWTRASAEAPWALKENAKWGKGAGETAHELFCRALRDPLERIEQGVSHDSDGPLKIKAMHEFRIACKSLRYLLEYREEVTGASEAEPSTSAALEVLTEVQRRLGDLHDLARRPKLLRSGRRAAIKGVRTWLENAIAGAESRLPAEVRRYYAWQLKVDFEGAFRGLKEE